MSVLMVQSKIKADSVADVQAGVEKMLLGLPEYQELLEIVEGSRAEPPVVEQWKVIGSYRLFESYG